MDELLMHTATEIEIKLQKIPDGTVAPKPNPNIPNVPVPKRNDDNVVQAAQLSCGSEHLQHLSLTLPTLFNRDRSSHTIATNLRLVTAHGTAVTERERVYQTSARLRQSA
eukprot:scaffold13574_cov44-Attheya_sp.AAC.2